VIVAPALGAQVSASSIGGRPATVRITVTGNIPEMAVVRQVVPLVTVPQPDGRVEATFMVVVTANCRWSLTVRPRFPFRRSSVPRIELRDTSGVWRRLDEASDGVVVVPSHAPCAAEGVPVVMRLESDDQVRALDRVQFDVRPLPR
jgi:hypothetical protein